jgi:hypothetical protein
LELWLGAFVLYWGHWGLFVCSLKQGLIIYLRVTSDSRSSCLSLPSIGITEVNHHAQLLEAFVLEWKMSFQAKKI